uniref:Solute carrier family 25 member 44 n=1 Tax=Leersia perrieri TaxID=77586 RepID=A0A0D9XE90_9ORYZ
MYFSLRSGARHGGEAIDRREAPPPPASAAAEKADGSQTQELRLPPEIDWDGLDKWRFFVLGAGLFSAVSTALYPAVVLKTRLQVAPPPAHAAASQRLMVQGNTCPASRYYRGGLDAFRKIVAADGLRGLYRGFGMSILTYAPSNAVWWATYSLSQKMIWGGIGCYLCEYGVGVQEIDDGEEGDSSLQPGYKTVMVVQGVSAAMAGGASALVTMPLDTIKTRMQVMDGEGEPITVGRTVRRLIKEGGWGACYRGLGPRWASMSLSATTMITTYEFLKRLSAKGHESGLS